VSKIVTIKKMWSLELEHSLFWHAVDQRKR